MVSFTVVLKSFCLLKVVGGVLFFFFFACIFLRFTFPSFNSLISSS